MFVASLCRTAPPNRRRLPASVVDSYMKRVQETKTDEWSPSWKPGTDGYRAPYTFSLDKREKPELDYKDANWMMAHLPYTAFSGLRFPSLYSADNYKILKDKGLERLDPKAFPLRIDAERRLHPQFRNYIFFLHALDPVRFTTARIASRYSLRESTVKSIVKHVGTKWFLAESGLTSQKYRQSTKELKVANFKERSYAKNIGYGIMGDELQGGGSDELQGSQRKATDWVRLQNIEVESMSAFPLPAKRNPVPKRVDVDMVVGGSAEYKIINWIDPHDKVPF
jgi:hypothetical protein